MFCIAWPVRCRFGCQVVVCLGGLYLRGFAKRWFNRLARKRFDLPCDVPDESRQLAGDGYASLVQRQLVGRKIPVALGQRQLRPPGDLAYCLGLLPVLVISP